MRAFRLLIEYDGSAYAGWQYQPGEVTLQGTIEAALSTLCRSPVRIHGAGRTDAGVHALGQVAHFHALTRYSAERFRHSLCGMLPRDISVVSVDEVPLSFHSRKLALGKRYRYDILHRRSRSGIFGRYLWHVRFPLDLSIIRSGLRALVGHHDFAAFCGRGTSVTTTTRTITHASLQEEGDGRLRFVFEGTGFLKHQVRSMVGTLVEMGKGKLDPDLIQRLLAQPDRAIVGTTAPPHGLTLVKVFYDPSLPLQRGLTGPPGASDRG